MVSATRSGFVIGLAAAGMLLAACGGSPEGGAPQSAVEPGPPTPAPLPADHPPLDQATAEKMVAPPPPGSGKGSTSVVWAPPPGWVEESPDNWMRKAQYRVGEGEGERRGECFVYYFGPGQGGDVEENIRMWAGTFVQPDGRPSREVMTTEEIEVDGMPVVLAEITGTYGGGRQNGGRVGFRDYMLLGAVVQGPDAPWFFKFTGPEELVRREKPGFRGMIDSLRRGR